MHQFSNSLQKDSQTDSGIFSCSTITGNALLQMIIYRCLVARCCSTSRVLAGCVIDLSSGRGGGCIVKEEQQVALLILDGAQYSSRCVSCGHTNNLFWQFPKSRAFGDEDVLLCFWRNVHLTEQKQRLHVWQKLDSSICWSRSKI